MNFQTLFRMAMDRELPELLSPPADGLVFDLGASGKKKAPGAVALGLPEWRFPRDPIPCGDGEAAAIHAYHFLEHLTGEEAILMLWEIQRALKPGGVFQFVMPWFKSEIASQDLTHKSFWTESSFRTLMRNPYYDPSASEKKWKLREHFLVIAGIVERNVSIMGQLVKEE